MATESKPPEDRIGGMAREAGASTGIPLHIRIRQKERCEALGKSLRSVLPAEGPIALEFGCGHGHWLTGYASAHPERFCLGVDLLSARVRKATTKRDKRSLGNLAFLKADARELLAVWPAERPLAEVFMLFPDPWPKKRHHKNRMIQERFLDRLADLMPAGARFHFRTDHRGYFLWTRDHFQAHPQWRLSEHPWPWESGSYFQDLMESWHSLIAERASPHPENEGKLDRDAKGEEKQGEPQKGIEGE